MNKRIIAIMMTLAMVLALAACGGAENKEPANNEANEPVVVTGTADGFGGEVSVTLTLDGDKVTKAEIVGEKETDGLGSVAIEEMAAAMTEKGTIEVDMHAGATVTSTAILDAAKAAMEQAK